MSRENVERWHDLLSHFPDFATDVLEVRDLGALTLSTARFHGSGGASEAPFEQVVWQVAEWREGESRGGAASGPRREALTAVAELSA